MVFLQHCFRSEQHFFLLEQTVFNVLQAFQTDWVESSTQSSPVIKNSCYIDYPVFCQFLSYQNSILIIFIPSLSYEYVSISNNQYYIINKDIYDTKLRKIRERISIHVMIEPSMNYIYKNVWCLIIISIIIKLLTAINKIKFLLTIKFISTRNLKTFPMNVVKINP